MCDSTWMAPGHIDGRQCTTCGWVVSGLEIRQLGAYAACVRAAKACKLSTALRRAGGGR